MENIWMKCTRWTFIARRTYEPKRAIHYFLHIFLLVSMCEVEWNQSQVAAVWSGPSAFSSPLLVCERLAPLQPRRDPVAIGQLVPATRGLQPADLGQHVKLLPGARRRDRGGVSEVAHRCTGTSLAERRPSVFIFLWLRLQNHEKWERQQQQVTAKWVSGTTDVPSSFFQSLWAHPVKKDQRFNVTSNGHICRLH